MGRPGSRQRLGGKVTCVMALYRQDADMAWEHAVAAGTEVTYRRRTSSTASAAGRLRDPFGQQQMMSQHIEDVTAGEMARRAAAFYSR